LFSKQEYQAEQVLQAIVIPTEKLINYSHQ